MVKIPNGRHIATPNVAHSTTHPAHADVPNTPIKTAVPVAPRLGKAPSKTKVKPPYSIASRWTEKLAKEGFTPISVVFLNSYASLSITNNEAMFITHLISFKWDDKMPFPGLSTIADKMNVSHISVRKYARDLENRGFLVRKMRKGLTTRYDLNPLFEALEKKLAETKKADVESKMEGGE